MAYGTLQTDVINSSTGLFSTNNAYSGIAKAWCQFTMGTSGTTITINGSFNISSVTYVATGFMTASFTTAMTNSNYSVVGCGSVNQSTGDWTSFYAFAPNAAPYYQAPTTSGFAMSFQRVGVGGQNPVYGNFVVLSN